MLRCLYRGETNLLGNSRLKKRHTLHNAESITIATQKSGDCLNGKLSFQSLLKFIKFNLKVILSASTLKFGEKACSLLLEHFDTLCRIQFACHIKFPIICTLSF